jgi:hypothetical protein
MTARKCLMQLPDFCWMLVHEVIAYAEQIDDRQNEQSIKVMLSNMCKEGEIERKVIDTTGTNIRHAKRRRLALYKRPEGLREMRQTKPKGPLGTSRHQTLLVRTECRRKTMEANQ